jgi:hypothetical protein
MHMTQTDDINRIGWGLGAFAALFGMAVLLSAQWSIPSFLPAVPGGAFAFDPAFVPVGALLVGGLWVLSAMLFAIVFADGHWRALTRNLDIALTAVWSVALLWLVIGPRVYLAPSTDSTAKGAIFLVLAFVVVSLVSKVRRVMRG